MKFSRVVLSVVLIIVFAAPLLAIVLYAISGVWRFPSLLPESFSGRAFEYIYAQRRSLSRAVASSLAYSFATVVLSALISIAPASLLARTRFRGRVIVEAVLLAPALVPSITFSVGVHVLFLRLGLVDTMIGVVIVLTVFSYPYMLRALIAGFEAYGDEYSITATNLGAGTLRRTFVVELPLTIPSMVAGGSVVFLVAFSEYFLVFLIGGGAVPSLTGTLFPFLNSADLQIASALTLLFVSAPLVIFVILDSSVSRMYRNMGMMAGDSR